MDTWPSKSPPRWVETPDPHRRFEALMRSNLSPGTIMALCSLVNIVSKLTDSQEWTTFKKSVHEVRGKASLFQAFVCDAW